MANITVKGVPSELYARLKKEAEANFRSLTQEVLARVERSFQIDEALSRERDQKWIQEALASGSPTVLTNTELDAILRRTLEGKR